MDRAEVRVELIKALMSNADSWSVISIIANAKILEEYVLPPQPTMKDVKPKTSKGPDWFPGTS